MSPLPNIPEWDQSERLKHERELTGFYITSHPLARYEATIQALATASTISLPELSDGREVKLCGIITTVKNMLTKKGDRMAYLTLEDLQGSVEIIVFPDLYNNAADIMRPERLVRITGTVDRGEKGTKIRGSKIEPLAEVQAQLASVRAPMSENLKIDLDELRKQNCRSVRIGGREVLELCFKRDGTWYHVYVGKRSDFAPGSLDPKALLSSEGQLASTAWADSNYVYAMVTRAGADVLRRVI